MNCLSFTDKDARWYFTETVSGGLRIQNGEKREMHPLKLWCDKSNLVKRKNSENHPGLVETVGWRFYEQ